MMQYVTYDQSGNLTGCYLQNPVHEVYFECTPQEAANWTNLCFAGQKLVVKPIPAPTPDSLFSEVQTATQLRLDAFAKTRGYDGILSACSYALSSIEKFATEGQYCVDARDSTWAKCYEIIAQIEGGMPLPTFEWVMGELPALEWPNAD